MRSDIVKPGTMVLLAAILLASGVGCATLGYDVLVPFEPDADRPAVVRREAVKREPRPTSVPRRSDTSLPRLRLYEATAAPSPAPPAFDDAHPGGEAVASNQEACKALSESQMSAYTTFRYDDAIEQAWQLLDHPHATVEQKVSAHVLAGAAWYLKGNQAEAAREFRSAAALCPGLTLDQEVLPQAIIELFEQVKNK